MVPILSRKSIIVMSLGLILGILAGFGYWNISPVNVSFQGKWPPVSIHANWGGTPTMYGSTVIIEPAAQGLYFSTKDLQRRAEYWGYKLESSPFLDFVSGELAVQSPEYYHTLGELGNMTKTKVLYSGPVTVVQLTVTGYSEQEAQFLATSIPEYLQQAIISEEISKASDNYQNQMLVIEQTESDLEKAKNDLEALTLSVGNKTDGISGTAGNTYWSSEQEGELIAANALVQSLTAKINSLTANLTSMLAGNSTEEERQYMTDQINKVGVALVAAKEDQARLEAQKRTTLTQVAQASSQVDILTERLNTLYAELIVLPMDQVVENQARSQFYVHDPSPTYIVPPEKIRARNAIMMGAVGGLAVAWLGLNFKWLINQIRKKNKPPVPPSADTLEIDQDQDGQA